MNVDFSVTLRRVELLEVTEAEPVIHVYNEVLREMVADLLPVERGGASYVNGVLSFGTPGRGLGRLSYRRVGQLAGDPEVHVFDRIHDPEWTP